MSHSQILAIVGLLFEALSVAYTAKGAFLLSFSPRRRYERYAEELAKRSTLTRELEIKRKEGYAVLLLLSIGMVLQGVALFV